ncbi:hypothetical protein STSP2_00806 [Anaerohalosphaera lusitana]|uniref:DUF4416 domain-containing protein n=1 Tax=Anaerohalosphaera lusitana TaxID=1936003 RepID=A0A1U9NIT8_9BACT|nr:hypothetical protein STSP2_00806 [Anaerohalosphaera lusitana]
MWEVGRPEPVKLIVGILGADEECLRFARERVEDEFGELDFVSEVWAFDQTRYYEDELGERPLRQFVSVGELVDPGRLAGIKHAANDMERELADEVGGELGRPVNLDPGYLEPAKLVLASTKNFAHRIYIGEGMYAEITLGYRRGEWLGFEYSFPDYKGGRYHAFLSKVRARLVEQLREMRRGG